MLNGRIGKQPFDIASLVQHESGENQRDQAHDDHDGPWIDGIWVGRDDHLETQQRIECHVEQQPREHRRNRRRTLGVGVGQPSVKWYQTHLGAIADKQEDEGEIEQ